MRKVLLYNPFPHKTNLRNPSTSTFVRFQKLHVEFRDEWISFRGEE